MSLKSMREIKFRCKIKGDAGVYKVQAICWLNLKIRIARNCWDEWLDFKKIQDLMQYTGLKDLTEREIYEGDILKVKRNYNNIKSVYICKVKWEAAHFICNDDNYSCCLDVTVENGGCEVIGNIYENPELINQPAINKKEGYEKRNKI